MNRSLLVSACHGTACLLRDCPLTSLFYFCIADIPGLSPDIPLESTNNQEKPGKVFINDDLERYNKNKNE